MDEVIFHVDRFLMNVDGVLLEVDRVILQVDGVIIDFYYYEYVHCHGTASFCMSEILVPCRFLKLDIAEWINRSYLFDSTLVLLLFVLFTINDSSA